MPLQRYESGRVFLGGDDCVHFGMLVPGTDKIIPCRVSCEALDEHYGASLEDFLLAFETYRGDIEYAAAAKFDRLIEPDKVSVTTDDL